VQDPKISFNGFVTSVFGPRWAAAGIREKEHVARVATQVALAIDCMVRGCQSTNLIYGVSLNVKWEGDVSFLYFVEDAFKPPLQEARTREQQERHADMMAHKTSLKAWKLAKRCGIKIRGTDNLFEHLLLDVKTMTLKVFHQVSFLRAHLAKSKLEPIDLNFEESLARQGTPLRQGSQLR
jgi:hypothetical protein